MKADIYSAGIILYILLSGLSPFYGQTRKEVLANNKKGNITFPIENWSCINESAINLVKCMLESDPNKRYTAEQCLSHPWLSEITVVSSLTSLSLTLENLSKFFDEYFHY
jgi:calcium-dependent protein kinase